MTSEGDTMISESGTTTSEGSTTTSKGINMTNGWHFDLTGRDSGREAT